MPRRILRAEPQHQIATQRRIGWSPKCTRRRCCSLVATRDVARPESFGCAQFLEVLADFFEIRRVEKDQNTGNSELRDKVVANNLEMCKITEELNRKLTKVSTDLSHERKERVKLEKDHESTKQQMAGLHTQNERLFDMIISLKHNPQHFLQMVATLENS